MKHYRGIKILNEVKMTNTDGSADDKTMKAIDKLCDRLNETGFKLIGAFKNTSEPIKARCNKGHNINVRVNNFVNKKTGCNKCQTTKLRNPYEESFYQFIKRYQLTMLEEWQGKDKHYPYKLRCKCGKIHHYTPKDTKQEFHYCNECYKKFGYYSVPVKSPKQWEKEREQDGKI